MHHSDESPELQKAYNTCERSLLKMKYATSLSFGIFLHLLWRCIDDDVKKIIATWIREVLDPYGKVPPQNSFEFAKKVYNWMTCKNHPIKPTVNIFKQYIQTPEALDKFIANAWEHLSRQKQIALTKTLLHILEHDSQILWDDKINGLTKAEILHNPPTATPGFILSMWRYSLDISGVKLSKSFYDNIKNNSNYLEEAAEIYDGQYIWLRLAKKSKYKKLRKKYDAPPSVPGDATSGNISESLPLYDVQVPPQTPSHYPMTDATFDAYVKKIIFKAASNTLNAMRSIWFPIGTSVVFTIMFCIALFSPSHREHWYLYPGYIIISFLLVTICIQIRKYLLAMPNLTMNEGTLYVFLLGPIVMVPITLVVFLEMSSTFSTIVRVFNLAYISLVAKGLFIMSNIAMDYFVLKQRFPGHIVSPSAFSIAPLLATIALIINEGFFVTHIRYTDAVHGFTIFVFSSIMVNLQVGRYKSYFKIPFKDLKPSIIIFVTISWIAYLWTMYRLRDSYNLIPLVVGFVLSLIFAIQPRRKSPQPIK